MNHLLSSIECLDLEQVEQYYKRERERERQRERETERQRENNDRERDSERQTEERARNHFYLFSSFIPSE